MLGSQVIDPTELEPNLSQPKYAGLAVVAMAIAWISICYLLLGHDFGRSLWIDEGYNVDEAVMQERAENGLLRFRASFVALGFLGASLLVFARGPKFQVRNFLGIVFLASFAICVTSILWSEEPMLTLRRIVTIVCSFSAALGIGKALRARHICLLAFVFSCTSIGIGLLTEFALRTFQPWNLEYRFAGLSHPNTSGIECAVLIIAGYLLSREHKRFRPLILGIMAVTFVLLLLTKSRTSLACCMLSLGSIWLLDTSTKVKLVTLFLGLSCVCIFFGLLLVAGIDDPDAFSRAFLLGREDDTGTFTGRIPIWTTLFEEISKRPFFGYGLNTFWREEILAYMASQHEWAVPNAHNAYIETTLSLGIIGLLTVLLTVVVGMYYVSQPFYRDLDRCYALAFALASFGWLNGFFESHMLENFNFTPFVVAALFARIGFFEDRAQKTDTDERH